MAPVTGTDFTVLPAELDRRDWSKTTSQQMPTVQTYHGYVLTKRDRWTRRHRKHIHYTAY